MVKRGLGKGLGALLPAEESLAGDAPNDGGVLAVPLAQISPNREQPRQVFDDDKIDELADSVREHGILQPIVLRKVAEDRYELIMGERRLRAAKKAGLKEIPAVLREAEDKNMAELALIENLQREDLTPLEEAAAFQSMMADYGHTQESLAASLGKSRSYIANSLRLLSLDEVEKDALMANLITPGHARALLSVKLEDNRVCLLREIKKNHLSVRQAEDLAKKLNDHDANKPLKRPLQAEKPIFYRQMEDKMRTRFGTKVEIRKVGKGGRIEIDYYSEEDLNRILSLFIEEEPSLAE